MEIVEKSEGTATVTNHLYYGNNLDILRENINDESIDLIYLDPPFNSQAAYNVLFRSPAGKQSPAQIEAFLILSDFGVHSFRPPMEEAMSRLWSQLG